jgi:CelD/BcsL family acetyltransferase involved in cellulose biosynthesis
MVELIDDRDAFERLRPEWTELLASSAANCLFLTWEWLFTWWQHLSGDRRLCVITVRSGGKLIAIAPFGRSTRRVANLLPLQSLEFLGSGTVGSDYLDIIVRRGSEAEALGALATYLAETAVVLDLARIDAKSSVVSKLAAALTKNGWRKVRREAGVCPVIPLAGHTWESYLSTLGADHRYNFQRRLRQANRNFTMRFEQARTPAECGEALDRLIALHNQRWQGHGGSDAFDGVDIVRFHHAMTRLALERNWLRLFLLSFDGVPTAALYGFLYGRTFYFYQSGYDPRYRKHSAGLLAMGLAIKSAIDEGAAHYDLLHGDESYKFHWTKDVRELQHLELYPPERRAAMARRVRRVTRAVKKTARDVLPKTVGDRISAMRRLGLWKGLYGAWAS